LYSKQPALEIALSLNRNPPSIYAKASRLGLKANPEGFRKGKEALTLRAEGLSYKEIATKMGVRVRTVRTYIYFARHSEQYMKLKEAMRQRSESRFLPAPERKI